MIQYNTGSKHDFKYWQICQNGNPDFFGEDGGRSSHHSDLENQWLQVVDYDEDTGDQNGKPSTLPYPFPYTQRIIITSLAFCQPLSVHRLQSTFN